jgi:hypothetical protein
VIGFIAELGAWRLPFLAYTLPVSLLSIALVSSQLPPANVETQRASRSIMAGFRNVLSDRSALACLTGITVAVAIAAFRIGRPELRQSIAFFA